MTAWPATALSTSYTSASFADKNVGTAKTVSVSGIAISGADAANYTGQHHRQHHGRHHRPLADRQRHRRQQGL